MCAANSYASPITYVPFFNNLSSQANSAILPAGIVLTEQTGGASPAGAVDVLVFDKVYYFVPSGDNIDLQRVLANTPAAIILSTGPGSYSLSFDPSKIPNSGYMINFTELSKTAYDALSSIYKFTSPKITSNKDISNTYQTYSYSPSFVNGAYTPTLGSKSIISSFVGANSSSFDFSTEIIRSGIKETEYYNVFENASQTVNISPSSMTVTSTSPIDITKHFTDMTGAPLTINSYAAVGDITGDFIYNLNSIERSGPSTFMAAYANGGAIHFNQYSKITNITGDFIGNRVNAKISASYPASSSISLFGASKGGAIEFAGSLSASKIDGNFIGNGALGIIDMDGSLGSFLNTLQIHASGGAISISESSTINEISGLFVGNYSIAELIRGGPGSSASSLGGAVAIILGSKVNNINADFIGNYATSESRIAGDGGAIYIGNSSEINNINGDFINNYSKATGGAITLYFDTVINNINGNFIGNSSASGGAIYNEKSVINNITGSFIGNYASNSGGAIYNYSSGTIGLLASGQDVIFQGNYAGYSKKSNAIYNAGIVNFNASSDYKVITYDAFTGDGVYNLQSGALVLIGENANFSTSSKLYTSDNTLISTMDSMVKETTLGNLTINGNLNYELDIDLLNKKSDVIKAINSVTSGTITITDINLISEKDGDTVVDVKNGLGIDFHLDSTLLTIKKPIYIYEYSVDDNLLNTNGTLIFKAPKKIINSEVLSSFAVRQSNLTVLSEITKKVLDFNKRTTVRNMPSGDLLQEYPIISAWSDFSLTDEDINLDGLKVENRAHTGIVGADIIGKDIIDWKSKYFIYTGYINSTQEYSDVKARQNAIFIGFGANLVNKDLFNSLTANIGTSFVDEVTSYGGAEFNMYSFSLANKVGYKYSTLNNRYILSPSINLGYHYIASTNYTAASNTKINIDAYNVFTIAPELRLVGNFNKHKPYISILYNKNIYNGGNVRADNVLLQNISADEYYEFSLGIDIKLEENLDGHAQITKTAGDIQGITGQFGFAWKF